jgi:hypothetical protein
LGECLRRQCAGFAESDHVAVHEALEFVEIDFAPEIRAALHIDNRAFRHDHLNRIFKTRSPAQVDVGRKRKRRRNRGAGGKERYGGAKHRLLDRHDLWSFFASRRISSEYSNAAIRVQVPHDFRLTVHDEI